MATINAVILPAKMLKEGKHKIRISVAHNGETRYIPTSIIIDSAKEFKKGQIVKRPDAAAKNTLLRSALQKYQNAIDNAGYIAGLTCSELVGLIKDSSSSPHKTLNEAFNEYISTADIKESTRNLYKGIWRNAQRFVNVNTFLEHLSRATILRFRKDLIDKGLSNGTILSYFMVFRSVVNYALKCGYVQYRINPFSEIKLQPVEPRNSWLSTDQIRKIRDTKLESYTHRECRDIFMLSFYLGGINVVDLEKINFNEQKDVIHYIRQKTERRQKVNKYVEFQIPDEAKEIINRMKNSKGFIVFRNQKPKRGLTRMVTDRMRRLSKVLGISNLVYYSARKTFSQNAFDLGISTSVIDYILGHKLDRGSTSLYSYISVTPEMATQAIRKVLDNLK